MLPPPIAGTFLFCLKPTPHTLPSHTTPRFHPRQRPHRRLQGLHPLDVARGDGRLRARVHGPRGPRHLRALHLGREDHRLRYVHCASLGSVRALLLRLPHYYIISPPPYHTRSCVSPFIYLYNLTTAGIPQPQPPHQARRTAPSACGAPSSASASTSLRGTASTRGPSRRWPPTPRTARCS